MTLRDRIKKAVAADRRTQSAIAQAAGMHAPNLCDYLAGRADLRGDSLDRLISALGLTIVEKNLSRVSRAKTRA